MRIVTLGKRKTSLCYQYRAIVEQHPHISGLQNTISAAPRSRMRPPSSELSQHTQATSIGQHKLAHPRMSCATTLKAPSIVRKTSTLGDTHCTSETTSFTRQQLPQHRKLPVRTRGHHLPAQRPRETSCKAVCPLVRDVLADLKAQRSRKSPNQHFAQVQGACVPRPSCGDADAEAS